MSPKPLPPDTSTGANAGAFCSTSRCNGQTAGRVLIVDDSAMIRLMAREALLETGYTVFEAPSAETGLKLMAEQPIDLVLLDLLLPGMSGFEACLAMREQAGYESVPVIVMTGRDDREAIRQAFECGATDFVTKPVLWDLLPYRVRYAIRTHQLLRESLLHQSQLANAQRIAHLGSWEWEPASNALHCSQEMYRIHGMEPDGQARSVQEMLACVHADDRDAVRLAVEQAVGTGKPYGMEFRIVRPDGSVRRLYEQTDVVRGANGQVATVRGIRHDITERVEADHRIRTLANYDALTGLANRAMFREMAQQWLTYAARRSLCSAVLVVDIDRFKLINQTLGSQQADEVLKAVGERLRDCVRDSDLKASGAAREDEPVARLGADEFTLLLADVGDPDQALRVAQRVTQAVAQPLRIGGQALSVSCSVGVAMAPQDGADVEALLAHAGTAMRVAKASGRDQVRFYDGAMGAAVSRRLTLEQELKRALSGGELRVYYQPKVDMRAQRVVGAEALLRWQHPQRGLVSPAEFVPVAEDCGLIVPMTHWVVRQVCAHMAQWRAAGLPLVPVSINLAAACLQGDDLQATLHSALARHGLAASMLEFEVTESSLMGDIERANHVLHGLKALGAKISIDDFGTGYSSLTYLKRFPVDVLKIDRSFIMDLSVDANDAALTTAIIAMGASLRLELLAEGVETVEQAQFLMERGCDLAQGYLFAKPLSEEVFADALAHGLPGVAAPTALAR